MLADECPTPPFLTGIRRHAGTVSVISTKLPCARSLDRDVSLAHVSSDPLRLLSGQLIPAYS
jgi:hypothetical protein